MSHDPPSPTSGRLVALDALRTLTISYLLLYHVAQVLARGGLSAAPADDAPRMLGPLILATGLWRMPLMFLITGASTEATLAVYEYAIRRTPVGRVLFGLPVRVADQRAPINAALARLSRGVAALAQPART